MVNSRSVLVGKDGLFQAYTYGPGPADRFRSFLVTRRMALIEEGVDPHVAFGSHIEHLPRNEDFDQQSLDSVAQEKKKHLLNGHVGLPTALTNGTTFKPPYPTDRSKYSIPMDGKLAFTARKLRIITVGTGFSGLLMAHKFQHRFPEINKVVEYTIFEKREDFGGTWLVNTYPGVQCDVPSHIYVCSIHVATTLTGKHITLLIIHFIHRHFRLIPTLSGRVSTQAAPRFTGTSSIQ